jgi:periplasmic copper chaperone A
MKNRMKHRTLYAVLLSALALSAQAQTKAVDPWVRATVPQQKATGLFVQLTSTKGGQLVSASSPLAATVEIHEMRMDDGVMRMREVPALPLPAGQAVALKPGGYHLMLMGLKQQAKPGDTVPVTLVIEGADKQRETLQIQAPVRPLNANAAMSH